jgi:hypothetical protein
MDSEQNLTCLNCGRAVKGRSDKKYCDDACRNDYNNKLRSEDVKVIRNINNALKKNRRILEAQITDAKETAKLPKEKLAALGYNFTYHTHTYTNSKGNIYYFCYEYAYTILDNDWVMVVKSKKTTQY